MKFKGEKQVPISHVTTENKNIYLAK